MTITPTGQAIIRSSDDGQRYVIDAKELDWYQVSADERAMGPDIEYFGDIDHPELGTLSWSVWEYPVGMLNNTNEDTNGHTLEKNFTFDPLFEYDEENGNPNDYDILSKLTHDQLRSLPLKKQQEHITYWFHSQFWDPAQETPYNGREGGYLYVHGGPYDAREELEGEFGDVVEESAIEGAVEEIEADGTFEWAPSPAHPDQLRAADEYFEIFIPQTLDEIRVGLESGAKINLDSAAAQSAAKELKQSVDALISAINSRHPAHGGIGHNGPAMDDEGDPLPDGFENELRATANALSVQMEAGSPDPTAVVASAMQLQRFRAWLQPRIDLAADEFAKEIGKKAATAVVWLGTIALTSILLGLDGTIAAALKWLQTILV